MRCAPSRPRWVPSRSWLTSAGTALLKQGGHYSNRRPGLVNVQALSGGLASQLWDQTEELLGLPRQP